MFENRYEIEILKIRSLKIEIFEMKLKIKDFEMKLKFENFVLGFWKLDFEIKNLDFINLKLGNL